MSGVHPIADSWRFRHGHAVRSKESPEYRAWKNMIQRCHNSNWPKFKNYGGRGISVCKEWRSSFARFLEHIGPRPSSKHSLDRIDTNGHYRPGNVRWATWTEQMQNRRDVRLLTHDGETRSISYWARAIGIPLGTIRKRMSKGLASDKVLSRHHLKRVR